MCGGKTTKKTQKFVEGEVLRGRAVDRGRERAGGLGLRGGRRGGAAERKAKAGTIKLN